MSDTNDKSKQRLRRYLNPSVAGENTNKILESLSPGVSHLIENVEAVSDQLYIATASGRYLDTLLNARNIERPDNVGLSDDIYREIGIAVTTRKQVTDLMHEILRIVYGEEFVRATVVSEEMETYNLSDGDTLIVSYDDTEPVVITFSESQFTNIFEATAQEVADAITREIRRLGRSGSALAQDNGEGGFVTLISETNGPSSSIRVLGGSAQNELRFAQIRDTSGTAMTQWTITQEPSGNIRATWSGGPNPNIGIVEVGDYANIFGTAFEENNRGSFTIIDIQGGSVGEAYVEWDNPIGVPQTTLQGTEDGILFFNPQRSDLNSKNDFAAAFQVENRLLEIFIPATTRIVRRDREGAAHLQETGTESTGLNGPYTFDPSFPFIIGEEEAFTTQVVDSSIGRILEVDDATSIPNEQGSLIFGFGTKRQEGPVPYISRPADNQILLNPAYVFENVHPEGTNISLVAQDFPHIPTTDGTDFPFYITDIVSGRIYSEELISLVEATGIQVMITVLFPNDIGLARAGTEFSDRLFVWGPDPV